MHMFPRPLAILAFAAFAGSAIAQPPAAGPGGGDISPAERAVFMASHLRNTRPGTTLEYRYTHRGSLDAPFDDTVKLLILPEDAAARTDGARPTAVAFLSGARRSTTIPDGAASGNPVILHFLERDIHEMERMTGGKAGYHRRKIRLALAEDKQVEPMEIEWQGRKVAAKRIAITPYRDFAEPDLKPKYGPLLDKRYEIVLSDAIPGELYSMRAVVAGSGDVPVVDDTLTFTGVKEGVAQAKPPRDDGKANK